MEFQLHEDQVLPFKLGNPVDSQGNEAPIEDGSLLMTSSDESVFTIEQDDEQPEDPEAKMFVAQGQGSAEFVATADADLGAGVETILLKVIGTVIPAGAVGFAPLQFGAPRPKKVV